MKNSRRILALAGVILLLAAFCLPMFFAFGDSEEQKAMFRASLGIAIFVPVFAYICMMAYRIFGKKKEKPMEGIANIIFDVGNVMTDYDWEGYLRGFGYPEEKYQRLADVLFRSETWNQRDKGDHPDEYYVEEFVSAAPEYEQEIREILRRSPECIHQREYAATWASYLKNKGYHLYVLSNYSDYMLQVNRKDMKFLKYMDGAVFSCEEKQIKPYPDIYQTLISRYDLDPARCVFLDDRQENCDAAAALGIHAIRFIDFKQAAEELKKLGVA